MANSTVVAKTNKSVITASQNRNTNTNGYYLNPMRQILNSATACVRELFRVLTEELDRCGPRLFRRLQIRAVAIALGAQEAVSRAVIEVIRIRFAEFLHFLGGRR